MLNRTQGRRIHRQQRQLRQQHQLRQSFEALERRVMMCSTPAELIAAGIPASIVHDDGHMYRSDFEQLSAKLQAHVDPHWVQDDPGFIDFDKVLGKPLFNSEAEYLAAVAHAGDTPGAAALAEARPDFFPQIIGTSNDTTTQTGRNLFRFGTQVNNQGAGPGCLISNDPGGAIPSGAPITSWVNADGSQNALQPVYNYTGSGFQLLYYRLAGKMVYHAGHGHLHYDGYGSYALRYRNANGTVGDYVQRSDGTGIIGAKVGFCLLTFSGTFTTESGVSSSTLPGYNQDTSVPSSCGYNQGIRVGHYDQYSSGLEGQWLDVTGVPNGNYFLEISLDAQNAMLESNDANNAKTFPVTLSFGTSSGGTTPDVYDSNGQHNDTPATAADLHDLGAFTLTGMNINWGQDKDYYEFDATSTGSGTISTASTGGDVDVYLYDSAGNLLVQSTTPGNDSITWNFTKGTEYYAKVDTYNSTTSSNYQIAWNIKPTVAYLSTDVVASEAGPNVGSFRVDRNGPVTSPITLTLGIGGTAVRGVDYVLSSPDGTINGNTLTIGTLASAVNIVVTPIPDGIPEPMETMTLSIASTSTYASVGGTFTVKIYDNVDQTGTGGDNNPTDPDGKDGRQNLKVFSTTSLITKDDDFDSLLTGGHDLLTM